MEPQQTMPLARGPLADQWPDTDEPVRYIDRTHAWYDALGTNNRYRYAHFQDVPFLALSKPLSQCTVTLVTTAAPYRPGLGPQDAGAPYNAAAKFYKVYSGDTTLDHDLRIAHLSVNREQLSDDGNAWFPLPALRRAAASGRVGTVAARFHGLPSNRSQRHTLQVDCPELLARCQADAVDVALLIANCPVCHQSMALAARHLEASGISTVLLGAARDIVEWCGVPRLVFSDFPLGNAAGRPWDLSSQDATLELALRVLETALAARTTVQSPLRWHPDALWKPRVLNPALLTADDIARVQAENASIKATAQALRDSELRSSS